MIVLARPVLGGKVGDEKLRAETMFPFTLIHFGWDRHLVN